MRKVLLMIVCAFMLSTNLWAKQLVPLSVNIDDDEKPLGHGHGRSTIEVPLVYIEDYTLSFSSAFEDDVQITLLDEDEHVVYTDWLAPGQTILIFPSTLSGEYTIGLTVGSVYYIGVIEL